MQINIVLKSGREMVKHFADYAQAKNHYFSNRATIKTMTDRQGRRV